jgi:hypothetical protein
MWACLGHSIAPTVSELQQAYGKFMVRRVHTTAWPVSEDLSWVPLTSHQQSAYLACLKCATTDRGTANLTSSLRAICQFAPPVGLAHATPHACTLAELLDGSAKLQHLHRYLADCLPLGAKVIIFCHSVFSRYVVEAYIRAVTCGEEGVEHGHRRLFAKSVTWVRLSLPLFSLFSVSRSPPLPFSLSLALSLSPTHSLALSLSPSHPPSLSLSPSFSVSLALSLTLAL